MTNLATISAANLPRTYMAAKTALSDCVRIDECKDWSDRAAAMATYARMAEDDGLLKMSHRIRGRAVRREGELLKEIESATGAHLKGATTGPLLTRKQAASDAGISSRQMKDAIRVANIPETGFEQQIESDNPPSVSALAKQGTKKKPRNIIDLKGRDPDEFNRGLHFVAKVGRAAETLEELDLDRDLPILTDKEREKIRAAIARIGAVTDKIATRMAP